MRYIQILVAVLPWKIMQRQQFGRYRVSWSIRKCFLRESHNHRNYKNILLQLLTVICESSKFIDEVNGVVDPKGFRGDLLNYFKGFIDSWLATRQKRPITHSLCTPFHAKDMKVYHQLFGCVYVTCMLPKKKLMSQNFFF